ncbi:T9SS type A sorting domain-containing protein [bacterium]|nr:T9SS type A sorting domain-containing protein [bacterium]
MSTLKTVLCITLLSLVLTVVGWSAPRGTATLDDPTFSFIMTEETIDYVPVTQDSSHWLIPYDFHAVITNLVDSEITLAITLTPVSPTAEQERRQYGICHQLNCYASTHGPQIHYGHYASGEVDTLAKFSVTWQITGDQGFPELADLNGDYVFDVAVYDTTAPEDAITYRLQLIETQDAVTIRPVLMPDSPKLLSNYPNPFNPSTNIRFIVEQAGPVNVSVYDILGRTVAELVNTTMSAGVYTAYWNAKSTAGVALPSGSYWVHLNTPSQQAMHRIVLIR